MGRLVVEVESRHRFGKEVNRKLRAEGLIPAIVYGEKKDPVPISVDPKEITGIIRSHAGINTIFGLKVKGTRGTENVMIKDYQLEPVEHLLLHVDLIRVAMDQALSLTVHIELKGTALGVKQQGGILDFVSRTVEISCLPTDIPDSILVDVSDLDVGNLIRAAELELPNRVTLESEPGVVIAHVIPPRGEVEDEEEAAAPSEEEEKAAEPELIKKGKAEETPDSTKS